MALLRLDKILAETGRYSRGGAAAMIKRGLVTVDGALALSGAQKCDPECAVISVCGEPLVYKKYVYLMMNKPAGVITATEDNMHGTVIDLLSDELKGRGLFPVGRLDKDTDGLLLLTDDGDFAHRVISPSSGIYKRYFVRADCAFTREEVAGFSRGIILRDNTKCLPALLEISGDDNFTAHVEIMEGKYHQIKRMMSVIGKKVLALRRVAIGKLFLDERLAPGEYRELTEHEISVIFHKMPESEK